MRAGKGSILPAPSVPLVYVILDLVISSIPNCDSLVEFVEGIMTWHGFLNKIFSSAGVLEEAAAAPCTGPTEDELSTVSLSRPITRQIIFHKNAVGLIYNLMRFSRNQREC